MKVEQLFERFIVMMAEDHATTGFFRVVDTEYPSHELEEGLAVHTGPLDSCVFLLQYLTALRLLSFYDGFALGREFEEE